jgi:AcrR family transcriptional regulator
MAKRTKAEQREQTNHELIAIAREIFSRDGYAGAATEEIVARAGVTRGALYHHFGSKEGLFRAVLESVQADIARRVEVAANNAPRGDGWRQISDGCRAFLEANLDPQVRRIVLIDAPAVLGWEVWREIDAAHSVRLLQMGLRELANAGQIRALPLEAVVHLLSGAMNEAALWIAGSSDPHMALEQAVAGLEAMLTGLKV